jgi:protein-S-isoprenylcysteine O-methyltransferase Ste14
VLYLAGIIGAIMAGRFTALAPVPSPLPYLLPSIGFSIGLFAVTLDIWAVRTLMERQTPVFDTGCARHLVTCGPFRFSRNPIYLGDALILAGLALRWDAPVALLLVPLFMATITQRFIVPEEDRLRRKFRADFARYCEKTRRWL